MSFKNSISEQVGLRKGERWQKVVGLQQSKLHSALFYIAKTQSYLVFVHCVYCTYAVLCMATSQQGYRVEWARH
jgi:hypothetical protein